MTAESNPNKTLTGKHVLLMFLAFFGVIFAVNGIFLSKAITSFPGETSKKSYLQGIHYNDTLDEKRIQALTGWRAEVGVVSSDDSIPLLVARLYDKNNVPLSDLTVDAELIQHSGKHTALEANLNVSAKGEYSLTLEKLNAGRWTAHIHAQSIDGHKFEATKEVVIP